MVQVRVLLLRSMGVLKTGAHPPRADWAVGMLEFADANKEAPRRLVLRAIRSAPGHGVLYELIRPELVAIANDCLKLRGIESFEFGGGSRGAMVQEWLVEPLA